MGQKTKPRIIGASSSVLTAVWGVYATWTTASQLPADARWLAKMLAEPPIYLPWLVFAISVTVAAWAFWPAQEGPVSDRPGSQITHGAQSPNYGSVEGGVHNYYGPAPATPGDKRARSWRAPVIEGLRQGLAAQGASNPPDIGLQEVAERLFKCIGVKDGDRLRTAAELEREMNHAFIDAINTQPLVVWGRRGEGQSVEMVWREALKDGKFSMKNGGEVTFRSPDNQRARIRWYDLKFNSDQIDHWMPVGWKGY